jgi:hypothetical protein
MSDIPGRNYVRRQHLPNSSPVPNFFFDEILPDSQIPHGVRSVFMFLIRKTIGWNHEQVELALTQIENGAAVSRHVAHHAIQLLCDCWGFFRRTPGIGRLKSKYCIGSLTKDSFADRIIWLECVYDTHVPTEKQLREMPCTPDVLQSGRERFDAERDRTQQRSGAPGAPLDRSSLP